MKPLGATTEIDFLQGGSGNDSLYAGADPVWMIGGAGTSASHPPTAMTRSTSPRRTITTSTTVRIHRGSTVTVQDTIDGNGSGNDTLMFLGDGNITLGYNSTANAQFPGNADIVTFNNTSLAWVEGNNISTIGVQTMGGNDTVTVGQAGTNGFGMAPSPTAKLGSWTSAVRVVDGGFANIPGLDGNVVINDTAFTETGHFARRCGQRHDHDRQHGHRQPGRRRDRQQPAK